MSTSKRILVIGGTGAQGLAVVKALQQSTNNAFTFRVLTRNPDSPHTQSQYPPASQVELFKGSFTDIDSVYNALQGCYGVFVNTDSFTVKEADEILSAMRIFETAKRVEGLKHFVWSGLPYSIKLGGYDPKYGAVHLNAKARVSDWLRSQPSENEGLAWSIIDTGPYMEMLYGGTFIPRILSNGTRIFSFPLGSGRLPLVSLLDIGFFTTLLFENREAWSGKTLKAMSTFVTGQEIADTLTKVTGYDSKYEAVTIEEWLEQNPQLAGPLAVDDPTGPTMGQNLKMWWKGYEDGVVESEVDLGKLRELNPGLRTVESWMRETGYDGRPKELLKKWIEAGKK